MIHRSLSQVVAAEVTRLTIRAFLTVLYLLVVLSSGQAADRKRSGPVQNDFPFQAACINASFPGKNIAMKGLAVRLQGEAGMLFDTDLLRMAAGWKGGFITAHGVAFDGAHGGHPKIDGEQKFGTRQAPGWADANGSFVDPRKEPFGPLPTDWCRYDGLYVNGMDVIFSYTVHGTKIYEQPSSATMDNDIAFVRTFQIDPAKGDLAAIIAETDRGTAEVKGLTGRIT